MTKLTIHTATYNRAFILEQAYISLKKQTVKDFEWIITDDGSIDNTEELVAGWLNADNGFPIIYNKLEHVGIPRALNFGVNQANTEWFMMLDSDDYILPETVSCVIKWLSEIEDDSSFAGIGFARCHPDGTYMKPQTPIISKEKGYVDATHLERQKFNLDMDMCEVHRTRLFKEYPFKVWPDEKFAPEQLSLYEIALAGYKLRWRAEKLYICDYLEGGLTKDNKIVKKNPMGYAMMFNQNMIFQRGFKTNFRNAAQMTALCYYSKNMKYLAKSNNMFYTLISFPAGIILGIRRAKQFSKFN